MKLPPPYLEVLEILSNNKDGLTTGKILKEAHKTSALKAGSELRDTSHISSIIYNLRPKNAVTTSDEIGGNIHRITHHGKYLLNENQPKTECNVDCTSEPEPTLVPEPTPVPEPEPATQDIADQLIAQAINNQANQADDINSLVTKICQKLDAMKNKSKKTIIDIELKIATLEKLAALHNQEIAKVLICIINDLSEI